MGPSSDTPLLLLNTWKPSLTSCTYWFRPTAPSVSGGAQEQTTPGKSMPSKFRVGVGIWEFRRLRNAFAGSPRAPSGASWWGIPVFGFSLSSQGSRTRFSVANGTSRTGGETSFLTDSITVT